MTQKLFVFGLGFSARAFASQMHAKGWQVSGTTRSADKAEVLHAEGFEPFLYAGKPNAEIAAALAAADAILISIAPDPEGANGHMAYGGDLVLTDFADTFKTLPKKPWLGYLSTVGVYGNHDGAWVDETGECRPISKRSRARVAAENAWQALAKSVNLKLGIFRLSGIYGPGRNPLEKVARGAGRRINKPGQVFNRIHVDDIAQALVAAVEKNCEGVFNITDDEPAPPQDVVAHAAELLNMDVPPLIPFEDAELSAMGRSFYGENKRVSNAKSKTVLGMQYTVPNYRSGMKRALHDWRNKP